MKVILASGSPRRKELMDLLNIDYSIIISDADETLDKKLTIEEQAKNLAYIKAKSVFDITTGDRIVIGSDTMVVKEKKIYGKPKDRQDAYEILKYLKNGKHQVITGFCILIKSDNSYKEYIDYDISEVYIKDMSNQDIEKWLN